MDETSFYEEINDCGVLPPLRPGIKASENTTEAITKKG